MENTERVSETTMRIVYTFYAWAAWIVFFVEMYRHDDIIWGQKYYIAIECKKYRKLTSIIENDLYIYIRIETISKLVSINFRISIVKIAYISPIIYVIIWNYTLYELVDIGKYHIIEYSKYYMILEFIGYHIK